MKYLVCYSGGHSSALVAIEAVKKYGKENVILLNHDISSKVEHEDIKRFKNEVAEYLDLPITYANIDNFEENTPLKVCEKLGGFKFGNSPALCTYNLKTKPFQEYLKENFPVEKNDLRDDLTILYGFDKNEPHRIQRRSGIMGVMGYKTDYPLAFWKRTINQTEDIGIKRPETYSIFKHANCIGCLKAGKQSWYVVYCLRPDIWEEAIRTEKAIGYSILKDEFLEELLPKFLKMRCKGILPNEMVNLHGFWQRLEKELGSNQEELFPCECSI